MPCSDAGYSEYCDKRDKQELKLECAKLEGMLCALLTRIYADSLDWVVDDAEERGKVDIKTFWTEHKGKDRKRLKDALSKYSEDELKLLKEILQEDV